MWINRTIFFCLSCRSYQTHRFRPYQHERVILAILHSYQVKGLTTNWTRPRCLFSLDNFSPPNCVGLGLNKFYSLDSGHQKPVKLGGEAKKPKKEIKTYITLLGTDKSYSVTTVEDAKKLAERRNFRLVKVVDFDPKSSRAVYQLMTEAQYLKEDREWEESKIAKGKVGDKVVTLSSKTNQNDVLTKSKMMKKWLIKKLEVKVVISGDAKSGDDIYKMIEKEIGADGRIVQKRIKGSDIRFQVLPPKHSEERTSVNSEKTSVNSEKM